MIRIGVLVSGGGSNLQSIIDSTRAGILKGLAEVSLVISNKAGVFALERAEKCGIPALFIDREKYADAAGFCEAIAAELKKHHADMVCLAGYLAKIEPNMIAAFPGKILNIHPALLPRFGGRGMYGHHVHEAVLAAGEKESGPTVHVVDEHYDHGNIVAQMKVPVLPGDTPDTLAARVLKAEHELYPVAIEKVITGSG